MMNVVSKSTTVDGQLLLIEPLSGWCRLAEQTRNEPMADRFRLAAQTWQ